MSAERLRGLYAITPEMGDTAALVARVAECLAGGAAAVQYRAKTLAPEIRRSQASALRALCAAHGALFIVNDSVELARLVDADGVHFGRQDGVVAEARAALGGRLVGISCYDEIARAVEAARDGADYVAIGSVFPSATKPDARRAPLDLLGRARERSGLPVVAIGGIDAANAASAIAAGADMVAVISAVFDAPDVRAAAHAIASRFTEVPASAAHARA